MLVDKDCTAGESLEHAFESIQYFEDGLGLFAIQFRKFEDTFSHFGVKFFRMLVVISALGDCFRCIVDAEISKCLHGFSERLTVGLLREWMEHFCGCC